MERSALYWIEKLKLLPHPEGGYYRETYRSEESINKDHLPARFTGDRNHSTAIYYLLENGQTSRFHRIKSDELWHFYDGDSLIIYSIDKNGRLTENKLGLNSDSGESPQVIIKAGEWFGARLPNQNSYCLAGCTVSPGFNFDDFEMASREKLLELFPQHKDIIEQLTNLS